MKIIHELDFDDNNIIKVEGQYFALKSFAEYGKAPEVKFEAIPDHIGEGIATQGHFCEDWIR